MPDTTDTSVVGAGNWWPLHRTEVVGLARWLVLAWVAQTIIIASVGTWIALEVRSSRAGAHDDSKLLKEVVQNK